LNVITFASKSNGGTIFCQLKPWSTTNQQIAADPGDHCGNAETFASIKEANILVIQPPAYPGLGQTAGFTFELEQQESTEISKNLRE
jgi:HAE1 family hydrophobic/amphiphilic exporter-1